MTILRSPFPDVVVPDVGLPEFLFGDIGAAAGRPAVVDTASGQQYTFGGLAEAVDRVAAALVERGLGRDDVIALFAPNCAEYPVTFHGVLAAGAVVSPVNSLYTPDELAHQLRDCGARVLVTSAEGLDRSRAAVAQEGVRVTEIIVLGPCGIGSGPVRETAFEALATTTASTPAVVIDPDDLAALPYSSGTSGLPKGVMLTHRNLVANLLQLRPIGQLGAGARVLAVLPLHHIFGTTAIMNKSLDGRGLMVTMPRFDLGAFLEAVVEYRIDHLFIVPPIALALAKHPMVADYDLGSVDIVCSAAAPLGGELARAVADRLDATVLQGFGLTESSPGTHGVPADRPDIDRGSIGLMVPSVEARVVDPDTGGDVRSGEAGELWCRGPNIMRGYLNNPAATATTIDADGFLHTGDIVTVDGQGVFRVVDRLKELVKYKGHQVAPAELEALLLAHEGITDAAVIGARAQDGEEVPKAFVVRGGTRPDVTAEDVMEFVARRVAPYKKIRMVEFVDRIPKSAAGKILRNVLREREAAATG